MKPIEILLVDDSQIHLEGLKIMLRTYPRLHVAGEAHNKAEVRKLMPLLQPDVVLLDIFLEDENDGIKLAAYITSKFPITKVIMLSHNKDQNSIIQSIHAGAVAYLAKDTSIEFLVKTIRSVIKGEGLYLGETIPHNILCKCLQNSIEPPQKKEIRLSEREKEIVEFLSMGYTSKEIAIQLSIDPSTVESHKEHIKAKFRLSTIIEIVVYCIKTGLIQI
ncbi:MAG: LuxR family transcriptional regulator [Bacteroidetes bacterium]|jgi:DNA-binding NarL/FixJ family response regulator|nr:LuxR family transcriptional regulator [Bacteroidota bacterium]